MERSACAVLLLGMGLVAGCGAKPPPEPVANAPSGTPVTAAPAGAASAVDAGSAVAAAPDAPDAASSAPPAIPPVADAPASDDSSSGDAGGVAYMESVHILYKQQQDALTKACWLHSKSPERAYAGKAIVRVGPAGKVVSTKTTGTDDAASACIDKQVKKWKFPPPSGTAMVTLPMRLHRD